MKDVLKVLAVVALTLLVSGMVALVSRPPVGEPITLRPPPTQPPLWVHVAGAVHAPGVYALPVGSRVRDAIQAAGGLAAQANPDRLNLAAVLEDGMRLTVPTLPPPSPTPNPDAPAVRLAPAIAVLYPLDINLATQEELETLPGIGPVTAERIIADREANGPYRKIDDLDRVSGIGPATLERIRDLVTVVDEP